MITTSEKIAEASEEAKNDARDFSEMSLLEAINSVAAEYPFRPALEFMDKTTSYKELVKNISITASIFEFRGISPGDCVAICAPNCPQAVTSLYAINKIGAVAVMLNPLLPAGLLLKQIKDTHCTGLVILDILMPAILKEHRRLAVKNRYSGEHKALSFIMLIKLSTEMSPSNARHYKLKFSCRLLFTEIFMKVNKHPFIERRPALDDIGEPSIDNSRLSSAKRSAVIIFSGGTSGNPKPVVHTSESINLSAIQCLSTEPPVEEGMSMLSVLPIFHIYGLVVSLHLALIAGGKSILVPRFRTSNTVKLLLGKKPTYMAGVPAIYASLLKSSHLKKAEKRGNLDFSGFRIGFCGGDKLNASTLYGFNEMIRRNGGTGRIVDGYGLTECCPVTVMPRDGSGPEGSIGKAFPGIEICIVNPEINEKLHYGEEGEICIFARNTMSYYLYSSSETFKAFRMHSDGKFWLHTGDTGKLDKEGFLFIISRMRRIIKVSGYSVFPAQIEEVLMSHPGVCNAAVTEQNEGSQLVQIKAYIVLKFDYFMANSRFILKFKLFRTLAENKARRQIFDYCIQKLAPWAVPKIIEFRASLPVNLLGKTAYGQLGYQS
ncbi:MAG: AMP-binding protein [Eubacteriales bacterium]|nr:AMP-binding protein [Eubacteriales bacterium]